MFRWHPHNTRQNRTCSNNGLLSKLSDLVFSAFCWLFFMLPLLCGLITIPFAIYQAVKPSLDHFPAPVASSAPSITQATGPWADDETTIEIIAPLSRTVYWTTGGKSYHFNADCPSLSRSDDVREGMLSEALAAGKSDPCNNCAK